MTRIIVVGISFKTAPVALREKLTFTPNLLGRALKRLIERDDCLEAVILSTCNRTEIYALVPKAMSDDARLSALWAESLDAATAELGSHLYVHRDREAAEHLFAVACGIDSQVLGESQILGQVQEAYERARRVGGAKSVLSKLFRAALSAGKRARTETKIGRNAASISSAAVELAKRVWGDLRAKKILLIGTGKMGELAAKNLLKHGAQAISVANRTYRRARTLARQLGGRAIRFAELAQALKQVDIVISSTAAPHFILTPEQVERAMERRAQQPLLLIDIAVPRNIDPAVAEIRNVALYNIDDLKAVAHEGLRQRRREISKVRQIIREEADEFVTWFAALDAVPPIIALREHVEEIRWQELERALRKLEPLPERTQQIIEEFSVRLANKFLHNPTERLKQCANREGRLYREALVELFGLKDHRLK